MNLQLVEAIVQISQTLSPEEQQLLIRELNGLLLGEPKQQDKASVIDQSTKASPPSSEQGWNAFLTLGQIAVLGKLDNAAIEHDRYLYSLPNEENTN